MRINKHETFPIFYGCHEHRGRKRYFQDANFLVSGPKFQEAFGVLDGHGEHGHLVASFCRNSLKEKLKEDFVDENYDLAALFSSVDEEVSRYYNSENSGTTVAIAILTPGDESLTLTIANAGDTRIVLSRGGVAERISVDHTTANAQERERIEAAGGTIVDGRICHNIPTRGLADKRAKKYIISAPYVQRIDLLPLALGTSFVLIASDGLWDVMSDQEAVDIALSKWPGPYNKTEELIEAARERGASDDVTCMMISWSNRKTWDVPSLAELRSLGLLPDRDREGEEAVDQEESDPEQGHEIPRTAEEEADSDGSHEARST